MELSPPSYFPAVKRQNGMPEPVHRFAPVEKPRQAVEPAAKPTNKIAGEVDFKPVATLKIANKNIFVRPVVNTRSRAVSHLAVINQKIPTRSGPVTVSPQFHQQLKTRAENVSKDLLAKSPPVIVAKPQVAPNQNYNNQIKEQLDQINKVLYEQIKQKVAAELAKQRKQSSLPVATKEVEKPAVPAVQKSPVSQINIPSLPPTPLQTPQPLAKPSSVLTPAPAPTPAKTADQTVSQNETKQLKVEAGQTGPYSQEIKKLEEEVHSLNQEILNLEKTIATRLAENETEALEKKVEVDERMLKNVTDWREILNNLIDSHSKAIKYLKQREDWLENKENKMAHPEKHLKLHRKPKSVPTSFPALENFQLPQALTKSEPSQELAKPALKEEWVTQPNNLSQNQATTNNKLPSQETKELVPNEKIIEQQTVIIPPKNENQKTEIVQKPTVILSEKEEEQRETAPARSTMGPVVTQQTVVVKPEKATLVQSQKEVSIENPLIPQTQLVNANQPKQPVISVAPKEVVSQTNEEKPPVTGQQVPVPTKEELKGLVKEAVKAVSPETAIDETKIDQLVDRKISDSINKEGIKEIVKEIIKEQSVPFKATVTEQKTNSDKDQTPVGVILEKKETLSPSGVNEIERQILEAAEKEEAAKEEAQKAAKAKVEEEKKKTEEASKEKEKAVLQAAEATVAPVTNEGLKSSFDKVKTSLTTIESSQETLSQVSKEKREEILRNLQNLEKDASLAAKMDELKAKEERRKINQQLEQMLLSFNKTPIPSGQRPGQTIETLKTQEKQKTSPAEKARVIAEIKELEREAAARKEAELSRPTVKAQPAFGRMLPNTPTIPNVINGLVKDTKGLLLPTVVIIVKDRNGDPVRAFKTNKIGQFALSTPLPNGTYTLELEKDGYDFDIIEIDVDGTIMKPIEIKAR